jgi:putative Holliday junction resolvase
VDFGSKRIGLAVGETEGGAVSPRAAIASIKGLAGNAAAIAAVAKREEAEAIVVGVPGNVEDERMADVCRKLGEEIRALGINVYEVDESMSSLQAEQALRAHDWTAAQRRRHLDSEAACQILERFMAHG